MLSSQNSPNPQCKLLATGPKSSYFSRGRLGYSTELPLS